MIEDYGCRKSPCEGCRYNAYCKENKAACELFVCFVNNRMGFRGREAERVPSQKLYEDMFPEEALRKIQRELEESGQTVYELDKEQAIRVTALLRAYWDGETDAVIMAKRTGVLTEQ